MDRETKIATLEAILFAMGESVELSKLAEIIEEEKEVTKDLLNKLAEKYQNPESGIELLELEDSYQLATKPCMYDALVKIAKTPRRMQLSESVLETLSIIAYKQPVTRLDVEKIRGVNSDSPINKLLEYGLIAEVGKLDAPGRPILFGTTEQFLRSFGVKSLDELPDVSPDRLEEFKEEAAKEVELNLKV